MCLLVNRCVAKTTQTVRDRAAVSQLFANVGDVMTRDHRSGHLSTNDVAMTSPDNNNGAMATQHTWDIADNVFPIVSDTFLRMTDT